MATWAQLLERHRLFDTTPQEIIDRRAGGDVPLLVSCGLGVNSTAGLILMHHLGDRPDAIVFADTAGERPETYAYRDILNAWLIARDWPEIITVKRNVDHDRQKHEQKYNTLEEECLVKKCLPSITYYHRSCSEKWKQQPQELFANNFQPCQERWALDRQCVKAIFYDADEPNRAKIHRNEKWAYWYILLDHDWGREECLEVIRMAGLPVPPKSACWFCSETTPEEIFDLRDQHPELLARALAMEANADLRGIKGLGKHEYSWADLLAGKVTLPMTREPRLPCICNDG